jgi:nucleotide-binding universal stress UspA family protein
MFDKLLLAVSATPSGEVATDFTSAFAREHGATVHVLAVNEHLVNGRGLCVLTAGEAAAFLADVVSSLRDAGVRTTGSLEAAPYRQVPRRIAARAAAEGVDAIIVGSNRRRGIRRLCSPNVRGRLARLTTLPLVVAPSPLELRALQLPAGNLAGTVPAAPDVVHH